MELQMDQDNTLLSDVNNTGKASYKISTVNEISWSRCRIIKNLLCSSCGILLIFTGFDGVAHLQSTMNSREGMGVASQAVIYAVFCISSLFLPKITIRKLGCKLTLVLSMLGYCAYIVSNFYPEWYTLIPTAILLGLAASLLWPSVTIYLNRLSMLYKEQTKEENYESSRSLFFGIFGTFLMQSLIFGNLISFLALEKQNANVPSTNRSQCGIHFAENEFLAGNNSNLQPPSNKELHYILIGTLLCSSILGVLLVFFFLDSLPNAEDNVQSHTSGLKATFKLMRRKHQLLLTPLALYTGMQIGFYISDFTKVYVACAWGIRAVGLVTMCFGFSSALCSITFGRLRKYTGRIPIFTIAAVANVAIFILFFIWTPDPEKPFMFFVCASLWGIVHGIYGAQMKALYGQLFGNEEAAAFANLYLWIFAGNCLCFSFSNYYIISTKIYVLISVFCLSQIGYVYLEYSLRDRERNSLFHMLLSYSCMYKHLEINQQLWM